MYATCLFCNHHLGRNEVIERFPVGRRLAYDAAKGRLWVVCRHCGRWNLTPLEERWEAIEECERAFRSTVVRVATDEIALARVREGALTRTRGVLVGSGTNTVSGTALGRLAPPTRLALEMVLHEEDERRAMEGELAALEARWREAEEIAAIADALTFPRDAAARFELLRRPPALGLREREGHSGSGEN